jgi:hypothetical protein
MSRLHLNKIESVEYTVHVYDNVFMQIRERVIIIMLYRVHLTMNGVRTHNFGDLLIAQSNYQAITTTTTLVEMISLKKCACGF